MRRDQGQATAEFALILPLIVIVLALVIQLTTLAVARLEIESETSRAARAASMAQDPSTAARESLFPESPSTVDVHFDDESVTVSVSRRVATDAVIIGRFVPTIELSSSLTMAREPTQP